MNQSIDQTKDNILQNNVVNVYCERSSRNENTSRSSTHVSMQQMVTGEMTVGTNNNFNYASNINVGFADTVVIHSMIDSRPVVVDQINVGSSDTVVIESEFKSFVIDYFKAGEILFMISH